jgi:hypothetical protein
MNPRIDYLCWSMMQFFHRHGFMPTAIRVHPIFWAAARAENHSFQRICYTPNGWTFEGIPIEQTANIHAVECSANSGGTEHDSTDAPTG